MDVNYIRWEVIGGKSMAEGRQHQGHLVGDAEYLEWSQQWTGVDATNHRWKLTGNLPVLSVVMAIYHYIEIIWRILVTPNFLYNIFNN